MKISPAPEIPGEPKKLPKAEWVPPGPTAPKRPSQEDLAPFSHVRRHLQLAKLACQSYEPSITLLREYDSLCFGEFGSLDGKQFAGFAVMEADRRAVFAFRGTLSLHNWKVNCELGLRETPPRHHGFNRAWQALGPDVRAWLEEHQPKWITLTGHSLGGAIATVAALDLAKDWSIDEVVVFGCPRVGSDKFVTAYSAKTLENITTRYVKTTDIVPRLPWEFMGYHHVGTCDYSNRHGEQVKTPTSLLGRVLAVSDLEKKEQRKYGVLGRLGIDLDVTSNTTHSPLRLYGVVDLLSRALTVPGWAAIALIVVATLLVDGLRHPMTGYMALLQRRLERGDKQTS